MLPVIHQFKDIGMIVISNIINEESGNQPGGYLRFDIAHPKTSLVYNGKELDVGRERVWKKLRLYSYDNGGFVNWWEYFGYHREPIEMNRLLKMESSRF